MHSRISELHVAAGRQHSYPLQLRRTKAGDTGRHERVEQSRSVLWACTRKARVFFLAIHLRSRYLNSGNPMATLLAVVRPVGRLRSILRTALLAALTASAAVVVRLPLLDAPMITDEGAYAYVARFWSADYQLYRDIPLDRPQGLFLLYEIPECFGGGIASLRWFAALFNGLTTIVVFLCARALAGDRGAFVAASLFAVCSAAPWIEGFTANAELFTLLPISVSALLTWKRRWLSAAFAAGAAMTIKPSGVGAALPVVVWLIHEREGVKEWAKGAGGLIFLPGLCLLHGWMIDWNAYWASFVEGRLFSYSVATMSLADQLRHFADGVQETHSSWLALALCTALVFEKVRGPMALFLFFWVAASLPGMALGGLWHAHYFQQILPPLAVGTGVAAEVWRSPRRWPLYLALAGGLTVFGLREGGLWFADRHELAWERYRRPGYVLQDELATRIRAQTSPDDTIYVAFAEAELYYLSQRRAAVPFFFWRDIAFSRRAFDQVIESIRKAEPAVIVLVQPPPAQFMSMADFWRLLQRNYVVVYSGPLTVLRRRAKPAPVRGSDARGDRS